MSTRKSSLANLIKKGKRKEAISQAIQEFGPNWDKFILWVVENGLESNSIFWTDGLSQPVWDFVKEASNCREELAIGYFSQPQLSKEHLRNDKALFYLTAVPEACLQGFRSGRHFLTIDLFNEFKLVYSPTTDEATRVVLGMDWLQKKYYYLKANWETQFLPFLDSLTWMELLSYLGIYLDTIYLTYQAWNPEQGRHSMQDACAAFNFAMESKLASQEVGEDWSSPENMELEFFRILKELPESKRWELFEKMMAFLLQWEQLEDTLLGFCHQGFQLVNFGDDHYFLFPPNKVVGERWDKIGQQHEVHYDFYQHLAMDFLEGDGNTLDKQMEFLHLTEELHWSELGFPSRVTIGGDIFDPIWALRWMKSLERNIDDRYFKRLKKFAFKKDVSISSRDIQKAISGVILQARWEAKISVGPLFFRTEEDFVMQTIKTLLPQKNYFNQNQVTASVKAFAFDLAKPPREQGFHLLETPVFKMGKVYCCVAGLMGNKRRAEMLQNFILRSWDREKSQDQIRLKSDGMVNVLFSNFKQAGFNVLKDVELRDTSGAPITDIDLMAEKNGEVLVMQLKDTYTRYDAKMIESYRRTLSKAGQQLDKTMAFIQDNPSVLSKSFNRNGPFKCFSLVVASTFEGNYERWGKGRHLKASLFELLIILKNSQYHLFDPIQLMLNIAIPDDRTRSEIKAQLEQSPERMTQIFAGLLGSEHFVPKRHPAHDLWQGKEECFPNDFIRIIETDSIWKEVLVPYKTDFPNSNEPNSKHESFIMFQQGAKLFQWKEYSTAIPFFERGIELNPSDPDHWCYLADAKAEIGLKNESIKIYHEIVKRFPQSSQWPQACANLAITYFELGDLENAFKYCEEAYKKWPNFREILVLRARLLGKFKRFKEMGDTIKVCNSLYPDELRTPLAMVESLHEYKNEILSRKAITEEELMQRSAELATMHFFEEAINDINKLLFLNPNSAGAWYNRGWINRQNKKLNEAKRDIIKAVNLDPLNVQFQEQLASLYWELGNHIQAEKEFQRAVELDPDFWLAWANRGAMMLERDRISLAVKYLQMAFEINSDDAWLCLKLGMALNRRNKGAGNEVLLKAVRLGDSEAIKYMS